MNTKENRIELDRNATSKSEVISAIAHALSFPDYWQPNWDSMEECLSEAVEQSDVPINIIHQGWGREHWENLGPYHEILLAIAKETGRLRITR